MYLTHTKPRAMAARWLVKGDEIACVNDIDRQGRAVLVPLRSPDSVPGLVGAVRWLRVESSGLAPAKHVLVIQRPQRGGFGHAPLHTISTFVILTGADDEDGDEVEGPGRAFYLDDRAQIVMRAPMQVEELDFVEHLINSLDKADSEAALRTLILGGDEEGQRVSAGVTSAELDDDEPSAVDPHTPQILALVGEGDTRRLPMRFLPNGVQGIQMGTRDHEDMDSVTARPIDEDVQD